MRETVSHYRILGRIGAGGMGEVYRAEDLKLKRIVALKFLSVEPADSEQSKQQLLREAQAAASLNHPNVATIYEIGQTDGAAYIAMEYVEGEALSSIIERGPLPLGQAIEIGLRIGDALKEAHLRGLAHCDIKSANIIVTPEGRAKVLDFGLSKQASNIPTPTLQGETRSTSEIAGLMPAHGSKTITGTLAYMSPEQIRGEPVGHQTDIFSFGVVLFEMLTARRPFEGDSRAALIQSTLTEEPPRLGSLRDDAPLELENVIRKALEKNTRDRYENVAELLDDLRRLQQHLDDNPSHVRALDDTATEQVSIAGTPAAINPYGPVRARLSAVIRRHRRWLFIGSVVAAVAALFNLILLPGGGPEWAMGLLSLAAVACFAGYAVARRSSKILLYLQPQASAFRGLLPFQEADRHRFYGREIETLALFEKITRSELRFCVLFGESGSGKTSLVRAGLTPRLWEAGFIPIYCRSYKDPLVGVIDECRRRSQIIQREDEPPIDYLKRVIEELGGPLIIVLDQFEEFFVNFKSRRERGPFISFVTDCHNSAGLAVKLLVSMRSDFLYLISSEFEERIPEPLATARLYHLKNFDEERAVEIIERSARKANLPFEPGFSRVVARDLAVADTVLPSELQIVGERLQTHRIFSAQEYRRAGGKQPLVHSFLDEVIQASGDKETCGLLLRSLISDENTRLTLTLDEVAKRTQRSHETVQRMTNLLVASRLVREIQDDEPWRYELIHEYLIERINRITGRVMDATQRANRLFRQYLSSYSADKGTRIPISKLWFIRRYSDIAAGERERELFSKSLRWGLVKACALVLLLAGGTMLAAAALSVNEEWEEARLKDGHTAAAVRIAFSPDGRLLVSCGEDGKVMVWDFARRERLATFTEHKGWIQAVAFSPDGKWFATGGNDQEVIVWNAARLEKTAVLTGHRGKVVGLAFSPDGRILASSSPTSTHGQIILWEVGRWEKAGELDQVPNLHGGDGNILFTPDGRYLVGSHGGTCDLTRQQLVPESDVLGANWIALSPNASQLVGVNGTGEVSFSALKLSGNLLVRKQPILIPSHRFHGRSVAFSPDGRLLASAADDIALWHAATQTRFARLPYAAEPWNVAFSPDGQWLVSSHSDGAILLWNVAERQLVANFNEHISSVRAVAFSRDGKKVASASEDRSIITWNAEDGRKETVLSGHDTRVTSVDFSPDGKSLASCDQQGTVMFWDLAERRPRWTFKHPGRDPSYCLMISPDGRWIATSKGVFNSAGGEQVVDTYEMIHMRKIQEGHIYGLDFSDDGKTLACVTDYGQLLLWDVENWRLLDAQKLTPLALITVSFSPDGKALVTGEDEGTIRLWNVDTLSQIAVIGRHAGRIKKVVFSPDGSQVASASEDQTIALWDVESRKLVTHIGTHTSPVLSVAFSPDGKKIVSGEHDHSVRMYTRRRSLWGYRLN